MNRPPLLLHLRIPSKSGFIGLWLPWFLVYPVLLLLMLVALPLILIAVLIMVPMGNARSLLLAGPYLWRVMFAMRGFRLDIGNGQQAMLVDFV